MAECKIDHIAITSPSLEKGAEYIKKMLGAAPQPGGVHPKMGTHNMLLGLGDSLYLEVISPDPAMPPPGRSRWFDLDNLTSDSPASLSTWVVRTDDIKRSASESSEPLGNIEEMSRGELSWLITIPSDGSLGMNGTAPALIEWHTDIHPASRMKKSRLSLVSLEIFHFDPERIRRFISSINLNAPVTVTAIAESERPFLKAHIMTPDGLRTIP